MKYRRFKCLISAVLILSLLLISGCLGVETENGTSFELRDDGTVVQNIVDDSDGSVTGEELENYINDSINEFQEANSGYSISLETCRINKGKVNISLKYSSVEAYAAFNNVICFLGTVKEAYDAGYELDRSFYSMNGMEIQYFELPRYCTDAMVLIVEEAMNVTLPGELYIISSGVTVESDGEISVDINIDESYSEDIQGTNIEPVFLIYTVQ